MEQREEKSDESVYDAFKTQLEGILVPDEPILSHLKSSDKILKGVDREIRSLHCCKDFLTFPMCLLSSFCLSPCGAKYVFWDNGKRELRKECERTNTLITRKGIYLLQTALTEKEATVFKWCFIYPKVYEKGTYGGITFISWENLNYEKFMLKAFCKRESKYILQVWSNEKPEEKSLLFSDDAEILSQFFNSKKNKKEVA